MLQVAELKQELKLRGLTVSGTKNDLIERLKNYQEQNGGAVVAGQKPLSQGQINGSMPVVQAKEAPVKVGSIPVVNGLTPLTTKPNMMRFSSTSSSPPVSPAPSDRSLAGMSPDETSCNGDVFGEMVSSRLCPHLV